jgi:hypothetical protein
LFSLSPRNCLIDKKKRKLDQVAAGSADISSVQRAKLAQLD